MSPPSCHNVDQPGASGEEADELLPTYKRRIPASHWRARNNITLI
jgi:hypothetical protein